MRKTWYTCLILIIENDVMETGMPGRWNIDNRIIAGYAELPLDAAKKLKKWKVMEEGDIFEYNGAGTSRGFKTFKIASVYGR